MTVKERVSVILEKNAGKFLSGEEIASAINVSRTAVWKAVKSLKAEGYPIAAVTNKGYCLSDKSDKLTRTGVEKYIDNSFYNPICIFDEVSSTNTVLREKALNGAAEGNVVISSKQTGGKGRMGRQFFSPSDTGIYLSILIRPQMSASDATLITTAAAVSVCEAIERLSEKKPGIKWVNDIFINSRKVCGILTEAGIGMENGKIDYAIVGIGINAYEPSGGFPDGIKKIAGAVFEKQEGNLRNRLAAEILNSFYKHYVNLKAKLFIPEYRKRCIVLGKNITVIHGEEQFPATALDVDDNCRLKVRFKDGKEDFLSSGEISIRL